MAAIHGLIDRTDSLKAEIEELKLEKQKNAVLQAMFQEQNGLILQMRKELDDLKAELSKYATKEKKIVAEPQANNSPQLTVKEGSWIGSATFFFYKQTTQFQ